MVSVRNIEDCAMLEESATEEHTHHSRSLYMMVKNTWRKRLTAFINTEKR